MALTAFIVLAFAVIFGAFGAHALEDILADEDKAIYETANKYHFIHGLGMLILSTFFNKITKRTVLISGISLSIGIVLFCGSLYLLALSEAFLGDRLSFLGMITPLGGISFIVGWLLPAIHLFKKVIKKEMKG